MIIVVVWYYDRKLNMRLEVRHLTVKSSGNGGMNNANDRPLY